jgi:hypothetical protein
LELIGGYIGGESVQNLMKRNTGLVKVTVNCSDFHLREDEAYSTTTYPQMKELIIHPDRSFDVYFRASPFTRAWPQTLIMPSIESIDVMELPIYEGEGIVKYFQQQSFGRLTRLRISHCEGDVKILLSVLKVTTALELLSLEGVCLHNDYRMDSESLIRGLTNEPIICPHLQHLEYDGPFYTEDFSIFTRFVEARRIASKGVDGHQGARSSLSGLWPFRRATFLRFSTEQH